MEIFETILPIFIISSIGYFIANRKYLSEAECDTISKFVFDYMLPLLLFMGTVKAKIPDNMEMGFLLSFYGSVLLVYFLSVVIAKTVFKYSAYEQSVFGMGASYSNATIIGIPVCIYALGEEALLPLFIIISIHNLILFTVGVVIAEYSKLSLSSFFHKFIEILKQLVTSPITGSLIAGGIINILDISIYPPLESAIDIMSKAAVPTALFILGTSLNKYKIRGNIKPAIAMVTLKILLFPFLVWVSAFHIFTIDPLWASTALLTSAMPVGISAYMFSRKYDACEAPITTGIFISTVASIFTLSLVLGFIRGVI